jgi:hypothetical protein
MKLPLLRDCANHDPPSCTVPRPLVVFNLGSPPPLQVVVPMLPCFTRARPPPHPTGPRGLWQWCRPWHRHLHHLRQPAAPSPPDHAVRSHCHRPLSKLSDVTPRRLPRLMLAAPMALAPSHRLASPPPPPQSLYVHRRFKVHNLNSPKTLTPPPYPPLTGPPPPPLRLDGSTQLQSRLGHACKDHTHTIVWPVVTICFTVFLITAISILIMHRIRGLIKIPIKLKEDLI